MKLSDELKQELEQLQNEAKQLMNKDGSYSRRNKQINPKI